MEPMKTHGLAVRRRRSNHGAPRLPRNHHLRRPNLYPYREFQMDNRTTHKGSKPISGWNYETTDHDGYSPTSRALEIAKRQQELMNMVQAMPAESDFELTLRDLVVVDVTMMEKSEEEEEGARVMIVEKMEEKRKVSNEYFSLVKMILSVSWGGRKRGGSGRMGSKVSPRNLPSSLSDGRKSSNEASRGSGGSSRHGRRGMTCCWSF